MEILQINEETNEVQIEFTSDEYERFLEYFETYCKDKASYNTEQQKLNWVVNQALLQQIQRWKDEKAQGTEGTSSAEAEGS